MWLLTWVLLRALRGRRRIALAVILHGPVPLVQPTAPPTPLGAISLHRWVLRVISAALVVRAVCHGVCTMSHAMQSGGLQAAARWTEADCMASDSPTHCTGARLLAHLGTSPHTPRPTTPCIRSDTSWSRPPRQGDSPPDTPRGNQPPPPGRQSWKCGTGDEAPCRA
jgi:hypothetical protein